MEGCVEPQHSRADRGLTPSGSTAARGSRRGNSARSQFGETMIEFRDSVPMERSHAVQSQRDGPMSAQAIGLGNEHHPSSKPQRGGSKFDGHETPDRR